MKKIALALLVSGIALFSSCTQEFSEAGIQLVTYELSSVGTTSAVGNAYISLNNEGEIDKMGFCISTEAEPDVDTGTVFWADAETDLTGNSFTAEISGLTPDTEYRVKSFAQSGARTWYGNTITFTTRAAGGKGWCVVDAVSDIEPTKVTVAMAIADNASKEVKEYGLCYNLTGNPTVDDIKITSKVGGYKMTAVIDELEQDTEYFVRAYFICDDEVIYSDQKSFKTLSFIKSISVFAGYRTAYMYGQVVLDAGSETTERGFCWGTTEKPTIDNDSYAKYGKGIGSYYALVSGLTKGETYYMRAYAINSSGVYYGLPIKFVTKTGSPVPGFELDQMVLVEAGTFKMGEPDTETIASAIDPKLFGSEPVHEVQLTKNFYMAKYQVTNEQLCAFLNCYQSAKRRDYQSQAMYNSSGRTFSFNVSGSSPNMKFAPVKNASRKPASNFTWGCAKEYLDWLSAELGVTVRMPTEAEWEFAARGGNLSKGYTYPGSNTQADVCVLTTSKLGPKEVGSLAPNELGIYDMSGNVFEYCSDTYDVDFYKSQVGHLTVDPFCSGAANSGKVLRGGSFRHSAYLRVSARGKCKNEADCGNFSGLRFVMDTLPENL